MIPYYVLTRNDTSHPAGQPVTPSYVLPTIHISQSVAMLVMWPSLGCRAGGLTVAEGRPSVTHY